jgi:hypothetical protein
VSGSTAAATPVVLLAADERWANRAWDGLAGRPGWCAPAPPWDLLTLFGRMLWGFESGDGTAGASALADRPTFLAAVRALRDDLIDAAACADDRYFLDVVRDPARVASLLPMLWPDAVVVESGTDADAAAAPPEGRAVGEETWAATRPAQLIVVLGAARSGTTWLHRMITAHPDVAGTATGETWLFPDIAPIWTALSGRVERTRVVSALRAFCDRLLAAMRDRAAPGAAYVCEKTPASLWRLPMLAELYPDAKYVHIVRDGRDAALSMTRTGEGRDDLAAAAEAWVAAVTEVRRGARLLPDFREVRYEDLLADPVAVVDDLWSAFGLEVSDDARRAAHERADERITPLPAEGPVGTEKWRSLPPTDQEVLNRVAGPLVRDLGYRVSAAPSD